MAGIKKTILLGVRAELERSIWNRLCLRGYHRGFRVRLRLSRMEFSPDLHLSFTHTKVVTRYNRVIPSRAVTAARAAVAEARFVLMCHLFDRLG